jgi:Protein of unknown function (DUF2637)
MTNETTAAPFWRPTEDGAKLILLWFGIAVAVIGAIALALSFVSVQDAARPYFGDAAWALPVLADTTIGVLTFMSIALELNRLRSALARYGARALVALTIYANVAPQHSLYGKILHGAPPAVWVLVVAIAENAIRRLMGLSDDRRIEALRKSLWLLRPFATWRIWRAMRIHQITSYAAALDRDAARAAVVGRLRLHHGRMWRAKAPLGERIALRLQGRDPAGVAAVLRDHADTVALLSAAPETESQSTAEAPLPETTQVAPPRVTRHALPRGANRRTRVAHPATGDTRSWAELVDLAQTVNAQAMTETGAPAGVGRLKREVGVGQPRAQQLRDHLAALPGAGQVALPAPTEHANGTAVGSDAR